MSSEMRALCSSLVLPMFLQNVSDSSDRKFSETMSSVAAQSEQAMQRSEIICRIRRALTAGDLCRADHTTHGLAGEILWTA